MPYSPHILVPQHVVVRRPNQPERQPFRKLTESERKAVEKLPGATLWFALLGSPPLSDRLRYLACMLQEFEQCFGLVLTSDGWMIKLDPEILEYPLNAIEYEAAQQDFASACRIISLS